MVGKYYEIASDYYPFPSTRVVLSEFVLLSGGVELNTPRAIGQFCMGAESWLSLNHRNPGAR